MKQVTISLDDALYDRAARLAAERGVTIDAIIGELLAGQPAVRIDAAELARREMGEMARRPGVRRQMIPWTREELYERGVSGYERDPLRGGTDG